MEPDIVRQLIKGTKMKREIEKYRKCDPKAMSTMSNVAILFAFEDMKADIISLHNALSKAKEEIKRIEELLGMNVMWVSDTLHQHLIQKDAEAVKRIGELTLAWELTAKLLLLCEREEG